MDRRNDQVTIAEGMDVLTADGENVGTIDAVNADYFVVEKGFFSPRSTYIPTSAIARVEQNQVYLTVTREDALNQEPAWDVEPVARTGAASDDLRVEEDDLHIDVAEEELVAKRRGVNRGEVKINKEVVAEQESIDVPITEERVEVTRRAVDRDVAPGDDAFEDVNIKVPVEGEEVDVEKRTHVTGEVDVDKVAEQHTERVSDTVRREEVTIEGEDVDTDADLDRRR